MSVWAGEQRKEKSRNEREWNEGENKRVEMRVKREGENNYKDGSSYVAADGGGICMQSSTTASSQKPWFSRLEQSASCRRVSDEIDVGILEVSVVHRL